LPHIVQRGDNGRSFQRHVAPFSGVSSRKRQQLLIVSQRLLGF
jgi:hypothetical protein